MANKVKQRSKIHGCYKIQHLRDGRLLGEYDVPNGIVDAGLNRLLDVMFGGQAKSTDWFIGLIDNTSFTALAAADTMSSHAGWIENDDYEEEDRQQWVTAAAGSRQISSDSVAEFTMNAVAVLKGIFIVNDDSKNGTDGLLWSTAAFSTLINVNPGDLLRVTYTLAG